jgi:hypothetical protein
MASPFGRAVGRLAGRGDADAWHIGRGPATKSPLWRVGCWLIGLAVVAVGLRVVVWVLGGSAPFARLVSSWLLLFLFAGFLMTVPYGLSRLRGGDQYVPPRDAFVVVPQKLSTVLFVMVFWRSLLSVGDELMTLAWNAAARRWVESHQPTQAPDPLDPLVALDPLEAEIRHAVDTDPGWWGRDS